MAAALDSIPAFLFGESLPASGSEGAWAQVVKNFITVHAGLYVNHSGDKSNAEQAVMALDEYKTWCDAIFKKYPNNKVQGYLAYTTATNQEEANHRDSHHEVLQRSDGDIRESIQPVLAGSPARTNFGKTTRGSLAHVLRTFGSREKQISQDPTRFFNGKS